MSTTYTQDTTALQVASTFSLSLIVPRISNVTVGNKRPLAVINNETGCSLSITLSGGRVFAIPAGAWTKPFVITQQDILLTATVLNVLPNSPVNLFSITVYRPEEEVVEPVALGNSPIGISGSVATTSGNSLKNDGNNPPVSIIESTPADQTQSSLSINNDGSGFWQVLSANVLRKVLNIVRGNSGSGKASITFGDSGDTSITTFYGNVGAGSIVPTSTITGVLPESQVGSGYPATEIGAGALPAGVTIAGSQVSGTVANATNANSVPAGGIQPGGISTFVVIGNTSPANNFIGISDMNGQNTSGIQAPTSELDFVSGSGGIFLKLNNYYDGTNDRYIDSTGFAVQIGLRHDLNQIAPVIRIGGSPVAGGIITWSPFSTITALKSIGGGAGGTSIWEGTSDPEAFATEGDFWAPA